MTERHPAVLIPLILLALLWVLLDSLEEQREKAWLLTRHQYLEQVLPLLRERATPFAQVAENLMAVIASPPSRGREANRRWGPEILRRMGSGTHVLVTDPSGKRVFQSGFSRARGLSVRRLTDFLHLQETRDLTSEEWMNARIDSVALFQHTLSSILGWNNIGFRPAFFDGERGFFILGVIPRSFPRVAANMRIGTVAEIPVSRVSREILGCVAVFVPQRNLNVWSRFRRQFAGKYPPLEGIHHLIRTGHRADLKRLPPPIAAELERLPAGAIQGTIQKGSWEAAYHVMPWVDQGASQPRRIFGVFVRPAVLPTRFFRTFRGAGIFILLTGGLLVGVQRWSAGRVSWASGLLGKVAFLSGLAILVPTFGLWWVSQSRQGFDEALNEMDQFRLLEDRLEILENRLRRSQGSTLAALRRFVGNPAWERNLPQATLASLAPGLVNHHVQVAILAVPGHPPIDWSPIGKDANVTSTGKKSGMILKALTAYLLEATHRLSLAKNSPPTLDAKEGAAGLLIEPIALTLGPMNLYDMAATRGILHPFGLLQESTWLSTLARRGRDNRPREIFLFVLDRLSIQGREGIDWVLEAAGPREAIPPFVLFFPQRWNIDGGETVPCWSEVHPVLRQLLLRCEKEGAVPRMVLDLDGRRVFCLGRKLTGSDMSALALQEDSPRKGRSLVGQMRTLAVGYPPLIGLLAGVLVWGFLLRPLHDLQQGVRAISAGNFDVRLPILTDDEIGTLCQSFNHVAQELEEKEFLERFLSTTALEQVRSEQGVAAATTHGSVLFADIRGFTHLSETLAPDEIVALLNAYLTRMETVIAAEGGTIDKFIGDALMAVFLPSHGLGNPAERATRAGLAMRRALADFNRERAAQGLFPIDIGVGIATGEILMGRMGREDDRQEFVLTGRTVNRAALMEKQSKAGRFTRVILCPATVAAQAQPRSLHELSPLPDGTVPCEIAITKESSHG